MHVALLCSKQMKKYISCCTELVSNREPKTDLRTKPWLLCTVTALDFSLSRLIMFSKKDLYYPIFFHEAFKHELKKRTTFYDAFVVRFYP